MKDNSNELVSIIVPIYNTQKQLEKCIESLLKQTYTHLEIILINDGSTDNSLNICKNFQKKDKRIILKSVNNGGVSKARNIGLDIATGNFILFVDSDDYIEPIAVEKLIFNAKKYNTDISICNINFLNENNEKIKKKEKSFFGILTKNEFISHIYDPEMYFGYVWNKMFSKNAIYKLRFKEDICYGEDTIFCIEAAKKSKNIFYDSSNYLYNYIQNNSGATKTSFSKRNLTVFKTYEYMSNFIDIYTIDTKDFLCQNCIYNCLVAKKFIKEKNIDRSKTDYISKIEKKFIKFELSDSRISLFLKVKILFKLFFPRISIYLINKKR